MAMKTPAAGRGQSRNRRSMQGPVDGKYCISPIYRTGTRAYRCIQGAEAIHQDLTARSKMMEQESTTQISRRTALKYLSLAACAAPVVIVAMAGSSGAQSKMSKAQANYQDQPKGDERCAGCQHFIADQKACTIVEGEISLQGWCTHWKRMG